VLRSGNVVQGPEVAAFESEFGALVEGRHCVAVNSGTSALLLALHALDLGPGDEVIVPSFTFAATANAVRLAGATPVFADIDPDTYCLDPGAVAAAIGPNTAAIMPVHLYGHPAGMTRISALAARHSLAIVEDAAQAHGSALHGVPVGALGDLACFSFYPTKNMHALEGGMVVTPDPQVARRIRLLRNQGMEQRYANEIVGYNLRLTDVAAAIGREQLRKLPAWNERRRANAAKLDAGLAANPLGLRTPYVADGATHVYHQYTIRVPAEHRDALQAHLTAQRVGSAVHYPTPVHRLAPFAAASNSRFDDTALSDAALSDAALSDAGLADAALLETMRAAAEVLSLPVHPMLADADLDRIVAAVQSFATTPTSGS
jgi:dTDP-4-amino-4,6-dideoxygalactose transaminase